MLIRLKRLQMCSLYLRYYKSALEKNKKLQFQSTIGCQSSIFFCFHENMKSLLNFTFSIFWKILQEYHICALNELIGRTEILLELLLSPVICRSSSRRSPDLAQPHLIKLEILPDCTRC